MKLILSMINQVENFKRDQELNNLQRFRKIVYDILKNKNKSLENSKLYPSK